MFDLYHSLLPSGISKLLALITITQLLVTSSLILIFVYWANALRKNWKLYYYSWSVPGPLAFPIIGTAYRFAGDGAQRMSCGFKLCKEYPEILKVWLGSRLGYVVSKLEYIENLMNRPDLLNKDPLFYSLIAELLGDGLLTCGANKWKVHRKLLAKSFNHKILDTFVSIFNKQATDFVDVLQENAAQKDFSLYIAAIRCHLENACASTMGVQLNLQTTSNDIAETLHEYQWKVQRRKTLLCRLIPKAYRFENKAFDVFGGFMGREEGLQLGANWAVELFGKKIFTLRYHCEFIWMHSNDRKKVEANAGRINELFRRVVNKKLQEDEEKRQNKNKNCVFDDGSIIQRKVVLDLLLEHSGFSEEELREEINTIVIAATETSAAATTFVLLSMGLFPEIQDKVYEEVMRVVGPDKNVEYYDLPKLDYTERVVKESLRLFPVVSMVGRYVQEDLIVGDYVAPAGTCLVFPIMHIHRCEEHWKDPLKFDPDRFLPENMADRHPLAYLPFSFGIRNCIGWKYAMMSQTLLLAHVIRKLRISTEYKSIEEVETELHALTRIKGGPKVSVEAR